jgi:glycosyltransferase involved in cell wall biosynthesis
MAGHGRRPLVAIDARGFFTGGGVGRYTRNLVREVVSAASRSVDVRLLMSNRHLPAELDLPPSPGVDIVVSRAAWMDGATERRWLDREVADADLVHVLAGHWAARSVPSIVTLHDLTPLVHPQLVTSEARDAGRGVADAVVRAVHVIAVSKATADDARRLLGRQVPPVTVVHHAPAPVFHAGIRSAGVLGRIGLTTGDFFLAVSALNPHKNLARLVAAYAASAVTRPLVIAGAHRDAAAEVHDAIARHGLTGRVRLVGRIADDDLAALYAGCLAFVYPSLYEGFGLPVVEAMACGAAVIASRSASIPEVAGGAAVIVDPASTRSLAAAMRRVDEDAALRRDLRRRALARAATFSWARAAASTLDVYAGVLRALVEPGRAA